MPQRKVETILPLNADRTLPPAALAQMAKAAYSSGVVDHFQIWDQMMGWWPPGMWNSKNAPLAAMLPDLDSSGDPLAICGFAACAAPGVGLTISTDSIRRGPGEMMQSMLTLANMGSGNFILQMGAGEIKQTLPFGWKRNEGLRRLEDHFRYYDAFWKTDGPIDMAGNFWNFEQAWIGAAKQNRPRIWALGGGPKLIDLATTYADGFATVAPGVIPTPERYAEFVDATRKTVAAKGRDADAFEFCPWILALIHEDPNVIERALDNPVIRWMAAIYGRLNNADWAGYGMKSAFPEDWHYSTKLIPNRMTSQAEVDDILSRVTHKMSSMSFIYGNPQQVADQIQPYIDAGGRCVDLCDTLPLVLDPADAQASLGRQIEVCRLIKQRNP